MEANLGVAQVLFRDCQSSTYGPIVDRSESELTIALFGAAPEQMNIAARTPARVVVGYKNSLFAGFAQVTEFDGRMLRLRLDRALQRLRRRRTHRKDCLLPASIRAIRDSGCMGAWHPATVVNLSFDGARVRLACVFERPHRVELQFHIPDWDGGTVEDKPNTADDEVLVHCPDPISNRIRPTARVVYAKEGPDGNTVLGLSFTVVSPRDAAKLIAFACDLPGEIDATE